MKITYVTGNIGKYYAIKEAFERENIDISFLEYDFDEPDVNDIEIISKEKARKAYEILKHPCFVADSGFYIDNYPNNPGYPGAFVKRSGVASNIEKLLEDMKDVENRNCKFLDCLTYYDGVDFYTFFGESKGVLAYEKRGNKTIKAKSNLWYLFIPQNCSKTLAEMTDEERLYRNDNRTSATMSFIEWLKHKKIKIKSKNNE